MLMTHPCDFFFLTTQSHLISLNLLWMSTFWNVSMKICHYPPNVLLHFFCHLSCASWRQGIAPFSGSCYTFCLPSHLFITWKHLTSQIQKEKEISRLAFVACFTFLWIYPWQNSIADKTVFDSTFKIGLMNNVFLAQQHRPHPFLLLQLSMQFASDLILNWTSPEHSRLI